VHLVIIAWLYVMLTMALTLDSAVAGVALFVAGGLGPVALYTALAVRRLRARREREAPGPRSDDP
jgi:hypothetical protein